MNAENFFRVFKVTSYILVFLKSFHGCANVMETGENAENANRGTETTDTDVLEPYVNWLDQDDRLRELWIGNVPLAQIAEELKRSTAAIMTRAARLGLPRRAAPGRKPGSRSGPRDPSKPRKERAPRRRRTPPVEVFSVESLAAHPTVRLCLMCLGRFSSVGRFNRICVACKNSAEYIAGSSIPEISMGGEG